MDLAIKITAIIALISVVILVFFLISTLTGITKFIEEAAETLNTLRKEITNFNLKLDKTISDISELKANVELTILDVREFKVKAIESLENFDNMSSQITKSVTLIEYRTDKFIRVLEPLEELTGYIVSKISPALTSGVKITGAVFRAFSAFKSKIANK